MDLSKQILCLLIYVNIGEVNLLHCGRNEKVENGKCVACPKCPAGFGLPSHCGNGFGAGLECEACVKGVTFRSDLSQSSCQPCTNCTLYNRVFLYQCREVVDAECGQCLQNYYDPQHVRVCTHCMHAPQIRIPECDNTEDSTAITMPSTTPLSSTPFTSLKVSHMRDDNPYQISTWLLVILIAILLIGWTCKCWIQRKKTNDYQCPPRNNIDVVIPISPLKEEDNESCLEYNSFLSKDMNDTVALLHPKHLPEKTTHQILRQLQSAPKVLRSVSDPGPHSPQSYASTSEAKDSAELTQQIPPAVVHVEADPLMMATPFSTEELCRANELPMLDLLMPRDEISIGDISFHNDASEASTLRIRNDSTFLPGYSEEFMNLSRSDGLVGELNTVVTNSSDENEASNDENNQLPEPEQNPSTAVSSTAVQPICITIHNNVTTKYSSPLADLNVNVNNSDQPRHHHSQAQASAEDEHETFFMPEQTIPKQREERPSACGVQHNCLYRQFHYPIQETVHSN